MGKGRADAMPFSSPMLAVIWSSFSAALDPTLFGAYLGVRGTVLVTVVHLVLAFLFALLLLWEATLACSFASISLSPWFQVAGLEVTWSFSALDPLMLCVVTGVAFWCIFLLQVIRRVTVAMFTECLD